MRPETAAVLFGKPTAVMPPQAKQQAIVPNGPAPEIGLTQHHLPDDDVDPRLALMIDPDSERSVGHIARLRRELRMNKEVSDLWDAGTFEDDVMPLLDRISSPTLIVAGKLDFICGPVWNRPIADGIRGARYVEIPDVGHLPQYEDPQRFRRELISWADGR